MTAANAGAARKPVLQVEALCVELRSRGGAVRALDEVSFDIAEGEVLGVVGESGAGKSLTGSAIIGLLEPPLHIASGRILFDGQRIDHLQREQMRRLRGKQIAAIFQDPLTSLNPLFTIGDQLAETIRVLRDIDAAAARRRAIELLGEVGIAGAAQRLDAYPHEFSGGMRQRVVIALALAGNPRLVIADEPTTALDVSVQAQILQLLKRLCRDHGMAAMLVTHDMGVIAEMADRVAVMYAGRVVESGPVRDTIQNPRHPYTVGLMNSIPVIGRRAAQLTQIDGAMPRLGAVPPGCAFNPRCSQALPRCSSERPTAFKQLQTRVDCWLYDKPHD